MLVVTICFSTALLTTHHHISTGLTGPLHLVAFLFFRHSLVDLCAWDLHPITWCSFSHAVAHRAMSLYFPLKCFAEEFMIDSATAWCPGAAKQVQIIICVYWFKVFLLTCCLVSSKHAAVHHGQTLVWAVQTTSLQTFGPLFKCNFVLCREKWQAFQTHHTCSVRT